MDSRQRIIEEASVMFRTYGIRAVTMDMLANQMGISKRTIYELFKDKDELLQGVLQVMTEKQRNLMTVILKESENVIEAIFKILDIMTEHFRNMSPAFKLDIKKCHTEIITSLKEGDNLPYYINNTDILLRGIREGVFRKDIDIAISNKCLTEVVRMSHDKDLFPPEDFNDRDIIRDFFINYLRGISTQKGLDLINYYEKKRTPVNKGQNKTHKV
jgi:TetR/AcrR family transcriptional regulator, cholesterol catabolism regulator